MELTDLLTFSIRTIDETPVRAPSYPIPQAFQEQALREIKQALDLGIIAQVIGTQYQTSYMAPTILVKKKEPNTFRLVTDYRLLNARTLPQNNSLPNLLHLIDKVSAANYLSCIDLTKGYNQVPCDPDTILKTGFTCLGGHYVALRMPFGAATASSVAQSLIEIVCRGAADFTAGFIDDVCVFSQTFEDHLSHLQYVWQAIARAKLTIRPKKVQLAQPFVEFLGHVVGSGQKKPLASKLSLVSQIARPCTKKQVRSFLGVVGFYRYFVPNFSSISQPLTDLLKKDAPTLLRWNPAAEKAFLGLKGVLATSPVLFSPNFEAPFFVLTDASDVAVAGFLAQTDSDEILHPIVYISHKLSGAETRYSSLEKEFLAIFVTLRKLKFYLMGRHFTVITDCQPLLATSHTLLRSPRIQRWTLLLAEFTFTMKHSSGRYHILADYLSRNLVWDLPDPEIPSVPIPSPPASLPAPLDFPPNAYPCLFDLSYPCVYLLY